MNNCKSLGIAREIDQSPLKTQLQEPVDEKLTKVHHFPQFQHNNENAPIKLQLTSKLR